MFKRVVLIGLLVTWVGCGKPSSSAPAGKDAAAAAEAERATALAELTQVVRRFAAEQRRAPKSLEELVTAGYLSQVPEAPAGKRFAISEKLEVYLAKQ